MATLSKLTPAQKNVVKALLNGATTLDGTSGKTLLSLKDRGFIHYDQNAGKWSITPHFMIELIETNQIERPADWQLADSRLVWATDPGNNNSHHPANKVASRLLNAGQWSGTSPIMVINPYEVLEELRNGRKPDSLYVWFGKREGQGDNEFMYVSINPNPEAETVQESAKVAEYSPVDDVMEEITVQIAAATGDNPAVVQAELESMIAAQGEHSKAPKTLNPALVSYHGGSQNAGAYARAIMIARDLLDAGKWDGESPLSIVDPYAVESFLNFGALDDLLIQETTDGLEVSVKPDNPNDSDYSHALDAKLINQVAYNLAVSKRYNQTAIKAATDQIVLLYINQALSAGTNRTAGEVKKLWKALNADKRIGFYRRIRNAATRVQKSAPNPSYFNS